jgi:hypothetical protein
MGVTLVRPLTLGEGATPLVAAPRLSEQLGVELHLKCEGLNPTGSFKDRGMAVAVGRAAEAGAPPVVCASTEGPRPLRRPRTRRVPACVRSCDTARACA